MDFTRKIRRFQRFTKGNRLPAEHVNQTSDEIENTARNVNRIASGLASDYGDQPDSTAAGLDALQNVTWTETGRQTVNRVITDSGTDTHTNVIATQVTMTATVNGQLLTWILNFATPP